MILFDELEALRSFLDAAPQRACTTAAAIEWLSEGGLPATGSRTSCTGDITVIAFGSDDGCNAMIYAVPDATIDPGLRAALVRANGLAFASEEIIGDDCAGKLWLLALAGRLDTDALRHLARGVPSVDVEALVAAREAAEHGAWEAYRIESTESLRDANVTACYTAQLAM